MSLLEMDMAGGLQALMTFSVHAMLLEPSATWPQGEPMEKLFRFSPLVCLYEGIWDSVGIVSRCLAVHTLPSLAPQPRGLAPGTDVMFVLPSLNFGVSVRVPRFSWRGVAYFVKATLTTAHAVRIFCAHDFPWTKSFAAVYMFHWAVKVLARTVPRLPSQMEDGIERQTQVKLTRGIFMATALLWMAVMFSFQAAEVLACLCISCVIGVMSLRREPNDVSMLQPIVGVVFYFSLSAIIVQRVYLDLMLQSVGQQPRREGDSTAWIVGYTMTFLAALVVMLLEIKPRPGIFYAVPFAVGSVMYWFLAYHGSIGLRWLGIV